MSSQKTIKREICFSGKALQTGNKVNVFCKPLCQDSGIVFKRVDLCGSLPLCLSDAIFSGDYVRRSTIVLGDAQVQTVEHFLAALWGLGIDNMLVEIDGIELPAMDGSAKTFLEMLKTAETIEQSAPREIIKILEPDTIEESGSCLTVIPYDGFSVSYTIEYKTPSIGTEVFDIELDASSFEKEIAPARTFCLKEEAETLLRAGLGKGADFENTLVMDEEGPIGTVLRFPNEPVRHKILDLAGDFYMLGKRILCRVVALKSGHALNAKMVKKIYDKYVSKQDKESNQ